MFYCKYECSFSTSWKTERKTDTSLCQFFCSITLSHSLFQTCFHTCLASFIHSEDLCSSITFVISFNSFTNLFHHIMTKSTAFNIFVHWTFLPPSSNPTLNTKVTWIASNLKEILEKYANQAFLKDKGSSKMKLSTLWKLFIKNVISDKEHFS